MHRALFCILLVIAMPARALANDAPGVCMAAKPDIDKDANLAAASEAAFPHLPVVRRDENCRFPLQLLHYGDADVLLSSDGTPGEACHGCGASLSAYVLRRVAAHFRIVVRFEHFAVHGTFGDPGRIKALQLAGHDAFALESGGTFQGYTSTDVTFYVFRDRQLVELKPSLPLFASDDGAVAQDATTVDGAWHVSDSGPDTVVIDYAVSAGKRTRRTTATWAVDHDALAPKTGSAPAELAKAAGR